MQYQTEAVVVSLRDFGEADKMVTLFSREYGKITAFAYGARRPRSRLAGAMQLFTHLEVSLAGGKNYDTIKQCEILQPFRFIQEDLNRLAYGMFMAELLSELCPERQPEPGVFDLFIEVLQVLEMRNPRIVSMAFAWQILKISGFLPEFGQCAVCGKMLVEQGFFHCDSGGCLCSQCNSTYSAGDDGKVFELIQRLLNLNWQAPAAFSVKGNVLVRTEKVLMDYLLHCLDKPLKSTDFIKKVSYVHMN